MTSLVYVARRVAPRGCATPESSLGRLRAVVVAAHPETARCRAGGAGRMLHISQVIADWATLRGQAVLCETKAESRRRRERVEQRGARLRPIWRGLEAERQRLELLRLACKWAREESEADTAANLGGMWRVA